MIEIKNKRKSKVRAKIAGTTDRARLSVFRSAKGIYAQVIKDGKTLASTDSSKIEKVTPIEGMSGKVLVAYQTGLLIASKAKEQGIESVVFDRGEYAYHGRVKALAEGARKGGLKF